MMVLMNERSLLSNFRCSSNEVININVGDKFNFFSPKESDVTSTQRGNCKDLFSRLFCQQKSILKIHIHSHTMIKRYKYRKSRNGTTIVIKK